MQEQLRPVLKWPGSRFKISDRLITMFPEFISTYIEPFCGSLSVMISLFNDQSFPPRLIANDNNKNLINFYKMLQQHPEAVVSGIHSILLQFESTHGSKQESFFDEIKDEYNFEDINNLRRAVLMFFLNRCCYYGIWKENHNGELISIFGNLRRIRRELFDMNNLNAFVKFIEKVNINNNDFSVSIEDAINSCMEDTFVLIDPPSYTDDSSFLEGRRIEILEYMQDMDERGILFLSLDIDTEKIRALYSDYYIEKISYMSHIRKYGFPTNRVDLIVVRNYE